MAMGLAAFFNIKIPHNFNSPYKSTSIIDFWRRWHMTLSAFLRDYLYIPLGGNRKGKARRYANLMATMLLGGLWHGAGWTFVIWGGLHGLFLTVNHFWREHSPVRMPAFLGWLMTSLSVTAAWVFFCAERVGQAISILKGMAGLNGIIIPTAHLPLRVVDFLTSVGISTAAVNPLYVCTMTAIKDLVLALLICVVMPNVYEITKRIDFTKKQYLTAAVTASLAFYVLSSLGNVSEFLYFQF